MRDGLVLSKESAYSGCENKGERVFQQRTLNWLRWVADTFPTFITASSTLFVPSLDFFVLVLDARTVSWHHVVPLASF